MNYRELHREDEEIEVYDRALVVTGFAWFGIPTFLFVRQCYEWLRFGYWDFVSVSEGLTYLSIVPPWTEWAGIQRVIDWSLGRPMGWLIFALGFLVASIIMKLKDRAEDRLETKTRDEAPSPLDPEESGSP